MRRRFRIREEGGGSPVKEEAVAMLDGSRRYTGKTDPDGWVEIDFPGRVVFRLEVGSRTVREDWEIGDESHLDDVWIDREADSGQGKSRNGVEGQVFWHDGTAMDARLEVTLETATGLRYSSKAENGYVRDDGTFFVPVVGSDAGQFIEKEWVESIRFWFVGGDAPRFSSRVRYDHFIHVMEEKMFHGRSDTGGLITGYIVDEKGSPVEGAKITGQLAPRGLLPFGGGEEFHSRSGKEGKFTLPFSGGNTLRNIYVNGDQPDRGYRVDRAGNEIPVDLSGLKAGNFGLYLVCPNRRFFGRLFS